MNNLYLMAVLIGNELNKGWSLTCAQYTHTGSPTCSLIENQWSGIRILQVKMDLIPGSVGQCGAVRVSVDQSCSSRAGGSDPQLQRITALKSLYLLNHH